MDRQEADDRQRIRSRQAREKKQQADNWQLIHVDKTEWIQDKSGLYVYISWVLDTDEVRLDIFREIVNGSWPVISFQGDVDSVRKASMRWLSSVSDEPMGDSGPECRDFVSLEHAAYIGAELERADTERIDYVQDEKQTAYQKAERQTKALAKCLAELAEIITEEDAKTHIEITGNASPDDFVRVIDVGRWQEFKSTVPALNTFEDSIYYLYQCLETERMYLVAVGGDYNIAEVLDPHAFTLALKT